MSESSSLGRKGEDLAVSFLSDKGYRIRNRNWKAGRLEVDIIAETGEFIVFVEVKTRSEDFLQSPQDSVTRDKQRSLVLAADSYIRWFDISKQVRFDVITVIARGQTLTIEKHIEDAFYPTLR
ncbi:MAG TPA: YraN family protein [Bacteroidales bacterium]|mgnify:CR=1 FL=1|jgi:putative endonuclease|nr:YraN family protein [Bacteroidales bacterium]MDI9552312.1 YraN family protein [Bacteroidota bacterium]MBP7037948.1 YraN family protein [Bacteroidales bacterium]MZP65171.1 endonuclease [Bacteroidales bacterium]NLK53892.1 endonuclease [Bacteroidales bacterium]